MKIKTILSKKYVQIYVYFGQHVRKYISTGVKLNDVTEWQGGKVVNRPDARKMNAIIETKCEEVERALQLMELQGVVATPENLSELINEDDVCLGDFLSYMAQRIEERELRPNSVKNHKIALEALRRFGHIKSFASLTTANIAKFDAFLRRENKMRSEATIHGYHKNIKVYVNEAVMLGKIKESPYKLFRDKKPAAPQRNPLTEEEINRIADARLPDFYEKAQDLFVFQAYTGLAYVDMMNFDAPKHLIQRDGHSFIKMQREKTSTYFYTPVLPAADAVILKYGDKLPRLSNQKYNMHLHAIAAIVGIDKHLTSHLARHSFATLMLSHDVPIAVVSKMLGHRDISVTQIYAKMLDERVVESSAKLFYEI